MITVGIRQSDLKTTRSTSFSFAFSLALTTYTTYYNHTFPICNAVMNRSKILSIVVACHCGGGGSVVHGRGSDEMVGYL